MATDPKPAVKPSDVKPEEKPAEKKANAVTVITGGGKAMKAKVHEKVRSVTKEELEQVLVWYGTKPGCPFSNFGIGGVTFAAFIAQTKSAAHGPDAVNQYDGNLHRLTRVRVAEVVEAVGKFIFRFGGGRVEVWDVTNDSYLQDVNDKPVGEFLYMVELADGQPFDRTAKNAPSMV